MARRTPSPARSPRMLVQTVSPLSLPPCPVPSTDSTSSIPPATARAEVSSAASSCTSSAPLAPVTSASASAGVSSAAPSVAGPSAQPAPDTLPLAEDVETAPGSEPCWLPTKLIKTIPAQVQKWISAALWKHWRLRTDLKLWYDPPEPALIYHQAPDPEHFFAHRLLLWVPNHLWKVRLTCPVGGKQLTSYRAHKRAHHVLDVGRYYLMITETLWQCSWLQNNLPFQQQDCLGPAGFGAQAGVQTDPD